MPFTITPRQWWGSEPPTFSNTLKLPVSIVVLSYTRTRDCHNMSACSHELQLVQRRQMKKGSGDINYNFMIGESGQVYEGRGWNSTPKLLTRHQKLNKRSLHIGLIGDYRTSVPSAVMLSTLSKLISFGVKKNFISERYLEFSPQLHVPTSMDPTNEIVTKLT